MRSVTQSLAWIARQTRPDLSYRISKTQSTFENACVRDLRECNRIVENATSTSRRGMSFSPDFSWDDAVVVTISDASFCQEQDQLDGNTRNVKSQQACITALAPGNTVNAEKFELGFDENQKSLSQYIDGRSLRTVQCCRTWIANSSYHRRHERTAQYSSVGGNGLCSNGTRLVRRL